MMDVTFLQSCLKRCLGKVPWSHSETLRQLPYHHRVYQWKKKEMMKIAYHEFSITKKCSNGLGHIMEVAISCQKATRRMPGNNNNSRKCYYSAMVITVFIKNVNLFSDCFSRKLMLRIPSHHNLMRTLRNSCFDVPENNGKLFPKDDTKPKSGPF